MIDFEILAVAEEYVDTFIKAREMVDAKILSMSHAELKAAEEDEEGSYLLQHMNNVGVIEIKGGLTSRDKWYNRYFGVSSYQEIKRAIFQAVDEGAQALLFSIDSPGGEVNGMYDAANAISKIPIPTVTFASRMNSAAYFLGSQADKVYADDFANVGSVGVVASVYDVTEMNKKEGVRVERFRSGDLKATGDPNFKLTDKERKYIQDQIMLYAGKFFNIVSDARGMSLDLMQKLDITSGRTFIGEEAKSVNLVDKIVTFEQALLKAMELGQKHVDKTSSSKVNWIVKK